MIALEAQLQLVGKRAWLDRNEKPNEEGMLQGIAQSSVFLLFLTRDVFSCKWCLMEIREALRLAKPFILLLETDQRLTYVAEDDGQTKPTAAGLDEFRNAAQAE